MPTTPLPPDADAVRLDRRAVLESILLAGAGMMLAGTLSAESVAARADAGPPYRQDLPDITMHGWQLTAVEVVYQAGEMDQAHRHPGFVFGYVIEGELRFQIDGGPEGTYRAGQLFYEPPGSVHRISGNASATKPARLLAMIFADKTSPVTAPV